MGGSESERVESGRDMKLILDEQQSARESFDVVVSEETRSENLTCFDGKASQDAFSF